MTEQEQITLIAKEISYIEIFCDDDDIYLKDILSERIIEGIAAALVRAGYVPCENEEIVRLREKIKEMEVECWEQMAQKISAEQDKQQIYKSYMGVQRERCKFLVEIQDLRSLNEGLQKEITRLQGEKK